MTELWLELLNGNPLPWLLEEDSHNPGVRYFALTQLLDKPEDEPEVVEARRAVMSTGPVPAILVTQEPEGYWVKPGPGYFPQYGATVWAVTMLGQLGADGADPSVHKGCQYVLEHSVDKNGAFSMAAIPSQAILCLNGHLLAALLDLGWLGDKRVDRALEWVARMITGEGVAPTEERGAALRYLKSGTCGPGFCCGVWARHGDHSDIRFWIGSNRSAQSTWLNFTALCSPSPSSSKQHLCSSNRYLKLVFPSFDRYDEII